MDRIPSLASAEYEQTLRVARSFRSVLIYLGMQCTVGFGMTILACLAQACPFPSPGAATLLGFLVLGGLAGAVFSVALLPVSVYRCSSAMGSGGLLWVIAMVLPGLNLMPFLVLSRQAKVFLTRKGVKVGLLGPSSNEIARLERRYREVFR